MRFFAPIVVAMAATLASPLVHAQDAKAIADATAAADAWLAVADQGNADATWEQSAEVFRSALSKADWASSFRAARAQPGAMKSRQQKSAVYRTSLPGAPDGEYVVIQYATQFERKANAIETVTPMREKDGSWKVSGYYLK